MRAQLETVWNAISDSVENPQRYMPDLEGSRVLERLEGGMVKELKIGNESAPGVFDFFVFERGVLREVKNTNTENENENVTGVFNSFGYEREIVRKVTVRGTPYRERILVSKKEREVRRELIDHPACTGRIVVKAVPISAQNPMAPVDLQFFLKLEFKKGMKVKEEEMVSAIEEEQQQLKERAEELEMRS